MYTSVLDTAIERKLMKPYGLKLIRQYFLFVFLCVSVFYVCVSVTNFFFQQKVMCRRIFIASIVMRMRNLEYN